MGAVAADMADEGFLAAVEAFLFDLSGRLLLAVLVGGPRVGMPCSLSRWRVTDTLAHSW